MIERLRVLVQRVGVGGATVVSIAFATALSVGITLAVTALVGDGPGPMGWSLSLLSPVVIGGPLAYLQFQLIQRLDKAERELAEMAAHDDLTHTYNRREFNRRAFDSLAQAATTQEPMGCLMLDVDNFKQVNDRYGHLAGDEALKAVAEYLKEKIQPPAILGRFGGDEFLVLLPGMTERAVNDFAESIRRELAALQVSTPNGPVQMTVSIGVFVARALEPDLELYVHRADTALYEAKEGGRNRVVSRKES